MTIRRSVPLPKGALATKLLLVDGDAPALRATELVLQRAGYTVATAKDGAEALKCCRELRPRLVIAEATLPGGGGLELRQGIQADEGLAGTRLLLLTSAVAPAIRARAVELGVPVLDREGSPEELVARVRELLQEGEGHGPERAGPAGGPEWAGLSRMLPPGDTVVGIDYALLAERLAEIPDDDDAVLKLIDGRRSLGAILERSGGADGEAGRVLARLFQEGLIRPVAKDDAPPAPAPDIEAPAWFGAPSVGALPPPLPIPPAIGEPEPEPAAGPRIVRFPPPARSRRPAMASAELRSALAAVEQAADANAARRAEERRGAAEVRARAARPRSRRSLLLLLAVPALAVVGWRALGPRGAPDPEPAGAAPAGEDAYLAALASAQRHQGAGAYDSAAAAYRRALSVHETSTAFAGLGRALLAGGQPEPALEALRRAVEVDARNGDAWMALAELQLARGRSGEARGAYERCLAADPQGARAEDARAALAHLK